MTGIPFYIGKGRGRRWFHHEKSAKNGGQTHKDRIIRKILKEHPEVPKVKIHENLTSSVAKKYEIALIKAIGRYPNGPLVNKTRGGDGCVEPSMDVRKRMSLSHKGIPLGPNVGPKIGAALRGKKKSPEHIAKVAAANRGLKRSPETCAKLSLARQNISIETRIKMRNARLGKSLPPEVRAKIGDTSRGRKLSPDHVQKLRLKALNVPPEVNAKIAETMKKVWAERKAAGIVIDNRMSEEGRERLRQSRLGKKASKETKELLRQANLGKKIPQNVRDKIASTLRGRPKKGNHK
jgi:hypothetical protein